MEKNLRNTSITLKMIFLTGFVGLFLWFISDTILTSKLRNIFQEQLNESLKQDVIQGRIRFDNYVRAHYQLVKLIITQKSLYDYFRDTLPGSWPEGEENRPKYYTRPPPWFPKISALRSLIKARYFLLLDNEGHVREVYTRSKGGLPEFLMAPTKHLIQLSYSENFITSIEEGFFLISSDSVRIEETNSTATLLLATPIDDKFLLSSQAHYGYDHLLALVGGAKPHIIVSTNTEIIPPGTTIESLEKDYIVIGQATFDYGNSDVLLTFTSLIPKSKLEQMTNSVLSRERFLRGITAAIFVISFTLLITFITNRINRLSLRLTDFSKNILGVKDEGYMRGDQLHVLEDRFQHMMEEVMDSRKAMKEHMDNLEVLVEQRTGELVRSREEIEASLKEKEILLREIHHRVKNNLQIITSLLDLQSEYVEDRAVLEIFNDSQSRIRAMALIHEELYKSKDLDRIDIGVYISALVENLFSTYHLDSSPVHTDIRVEEIFLPIDQANSCGLIVNELVSNSLKYAFKDGREGKIIVKIHAENGKGVVMVVGDNGIGISPSIDINKTESLGLRLVNLLATRKLKGALDVQRDNGTIFRIVFPKS